MGEAFDRDGQVLGEAFGETKREVFEKLIGEHPDAAEIHIRSLDTAMGSRQEMPRYCCHKDVWALKIAAIEEVGLEPNRPWSAMITPADAGYAPFHVDAAYMRKHQPQIGGYFVVYKDGYKSYSPAAAFEEGCTRIN